LAQRRLAFDWNCSCGANENAAGAGDPFFREAVSAHRPVFLSWRLPPSLAAPCTARRKKQAEKNKQKKATLPVERELEPTAFWRREIPEESRRRKVVGTRSRARVASVREVPRPVAAG